MKDAIEDYAEWSERKERLINQYKSAHRLGQQLRALSELVRLVSAALNTSNEPYALPILMKLIKILRLTSHRMDTDYVEKVEDDIDGTRFRKEMNEALEPLKNFFEEIKEYGPNFFEDNFSEEDLKVFEEMCNRKLDYKEWMDEINEEIREEKKELSETVSQVLCAYSKEKRTANRLNRLADVLAIAYSCYFDTIVRKKLFGLVYKELKKMSRAEQAELRFK